MRSFTSALILVIALTIPAIFVGAVLAPIILWKMFWGIYNEEGGNIWQKFIKKLKSFHLN